MVYLKKLTLFLVCIFLLNSCTKDDTPNMREHSEIGVYCVLEPYRNYNQQVILKRLPPAGEDEVYTSVFDAKVTISTEGAIYDFFETATPGVYKADFEPQLGKTYKLDIVTPEGEKITSNMSIPEAVTVFWSTAWNISETFKHVAWYGPLYNAAYKGINVSTKKPDDDYYLLISGRPSYTGTATADTLEFLTTNLKDTDELTQVNITTVKEELKSYPDEAFSYPQGDTTVSLSFFRKFILAKNPHKFNSNRLLGVDYYYEPNGKEYWDNGFLITGGPFTKLTPYPLRENTPEARQKFGRDSCYQYSMCLTFMQLTDEYVEYFKDMSGFPNIKYDQNMVFRNKQNSNINGGVGIFTSKVMTYTLYPYFQYWSDIHNKNFREHYLSTVKIGGYNK